MDGLNICHWNIQGWTDSSNCLKENIIKSCYLDIISINETSLSGHNDISLMDYTWYGFNRKSLHRSAARGSDSGCGLFVKNIWFDMFNISVCDKDYEGILGLSLTCKMKKDVWFCLSVTWHLTIPLEEETLPVFQSFAIEGKFTLGRWFHFDLWRPQLQCWWQRWCNVRYRCRLDPGTNRRTY